jgi:hypothetical protein
LALNRARKRKFDKTINQVICVDLNGVVITFAEPQKRNKEIKVPFIALINPMN